MDHNSLFYYKYFWDTVAPLVVKMSIMGNEATEVRYSEAKKYLNF